MQLLVDTHVVLWWTLEPHRITARAREYILDPDWHGYVSDVTFWELAIKLSIGKLRLPVPLHPFMVNSYADLGYAVPLPIRQLHILGVEQLPMHHRDPFDRLLVAQARQENAVILSADRRFDDYGVERVWD